MARKPKAQGAKTVARATRKAPRATPASGQHARREAILSAALQVFAERGFEAARLDDVAERAGVAKGTLYLYFKDKTALFEAIVRNATAPVIENLSAITQAPDVSTRALLERLMAMFVSEVLGSERKLVLRLVLTEGQRFPDLARFYHDEVVSRGLGLITQILERGVARGEIAPASLTRFPQLIVAPLIMSVLWDGLFQPFAPLDVTALLSTYIDLLTAPAAGSEP